MPSSTLSRAISGEAVEDAAVTAMVREHTPDVVVMDVRMPRVDGIAATSALRRDLGADGPAVLVLTTFDIEEAALSAIEAGADGFVLKDTETEFLLAAIRAVHTGSQVVSASATRRLFAQHRTRDRPGPEYDTLTDRERDVLIEVAHGKSNTEISRDLFITEATVKTHVSKLLGKLDRRDRVQLAIYVYRTNLL
ncbi:response regulator transcription factor [Rhodococcus sp. NPDC079359]|uniref:LuxR C-terminal-related transcriptional regulator n=1 Tax=Nocardiaceae TaxID=85025 RepID=UPI001E38EE80|nr:response regulator transcription factor [Rhodococcus fascians]